MVNIDDYHHQVDGEQQHHNGSIRYAHVPVAVNDQKMHDNVSGPKCARSTGRTGLERPPENAHARFHVSAMI